MSKNTRTTNEDAQRQCFIKAARQLDADEHEAAFKAKLAQIARHKVKDEPKEGITPDAKKHDL